MDVFSIQFYMDIACWFYFYFMIFGRFSKFNFDFGILVYAIIDIYSFGKLIYILIRFNEIYTNSKTIFFDNVSALI